MGGTAWRCCTCSSACNGHSTVKGAWYGYELRQAWHRSPRRPPPSRVKTGEPLPGLVVGDGSTIGAGAIVYAGTTVGRQTMIADQAFVRERCAIGDYVIVGHGVT